MGLIEGVIELVFALFIVVIFATAVFPALAEATGQNIWWVYVVLVIVFVGLIAGFIKGVMR